MVLKTADAAVGPHLVGHRIQANTLALGAQYCLELEEVALGPTILGLGQVDTKGAHLAKLVDFGY